VVSAHVQHGHMLRVSNLESARTPMVRRTWRWSGRLARVRSPPPLIAAFGGGITDVTGMIEGAHSSPASDVGDVQVGVGVHTGAER